MLVVFFHSTDSVTAPFLEALQVPAEGIQSRKHAIETGASPTRFAFISLSTCCRSCSEVAKYLYIHHVLVLFYIIVSTVGNSFG